MITPPKQAELTRMHATGEYTIADLMEVFSVGHALRTSLADLPTPCSPPY